MFTELNLANNKVLKTNIDGELLKKLQSESITEFGKYTDISKSYIPNTESAYLFRTPTDLNNPSVGPGYQWIPANTDSIKEFKEFVLNEVVNHLKSEYKISDTWYLLQTNEEWIDNPFHQHLTAHWVCSAYINVTDGDTIEFSDTAGNIESYTPVTGEVLIFPATTEHKPNKTVGDGFRVSLNMEIIAEDLPETDLQKTRISICNTCEDYTALKFCSECKCFMPFKTRLESATCPLNKW